MAPQFSIVVPAYREAPRIAASLAALSCACAETGRAYEIVVAVEPSDDGTLERAQAFAATHTQTRILDLGAHRGKGHAVREGVLAASGAIVFFTDADLSADVAAVGDFLDRFDADASLAGIVGVRRLRKGKAPFLRRFLSRVFHALVRAAARVPFRDTQCGFKAFRQPFALELARAQTQMGYAFDIEWLKIACAKGWRVTEAAVAWTDYPHSHIRLLRDGFALVRAVWRLRPR